MKLRRCASPHCYKLVPLGSTYCADCLSHTCKRCGGPRPANRREYCDACAPVVAKEKHAARDKECYELLGVAEYWINYRPVPDTSLAWLDAVNAHLRRNGGVYAGRAG